MTIYDEILEERRRHWEAERRTKISEARRRHGRPFRDSADYRGAYTNAVGKRIDDPWPEREEKR